MGVLFSGFAEELWSVKLARKSIITAGRNPIAVSKVENLMSVGAATHDRHLSMTFEAHQKLATLSSKSPREKGKMRVMGSKTADRGARGGRKGENRI